VRTLIEFLDSQGARKKAVIEYDNGDWHLEFPENKYYSTIFPDLLYEVEKDIEIICTQNSKDKIPNKSDAGDS
jgi:hypothetical protein